MPRGRPFQPGRSGNPQGRPRGLPNRATVEVRDLARRLLDDPEYLERLRVRLHRGTAGAIEQTLFFYAFGKPKEEIEQQGTLTIIHEIPDDE